MRLRIECSGLLTHFKMHHFNLLTSIQFNQINSTCISLSTQYIVYYRIGNWNMILHSINVILKDAVTSSTAYKTNERKFISSVSCQNNCVRQKTGCKFRNKRVNSRSELLHVRVYRVICGFLYCSFSPDSYPSRNPH